MRESTKQILIRMPKQLERAIRREAEKQRRSRHAQILAILEAFCQSADEPKEKAA